MIPIIVCTNAGPISVGSGRKGAMTSMAIAISMTFKIVPTPGVSRNGIHINRTKTLTMKVDSPTVKPVCLPIPCAKTVQGLTPIPEAMIIASPVPNIQRPVTRKRKVIGLGLNVRGVSELQNVLGTLWAGLMISNTDFSDKPDHTSSNANNCRATASGNRRRASAG